jgi:hypothetical protein
MNKMKRLLRSGATLGLVLAAAAGFKVVVAQTATAKTPAANVPAAKPHEVEVPLFEVDPGFFKLPNGWHFASVSDVSCDSHDNVWVFQRPDDIYTDWKTGPAVMQFDPKGNYIQGWGGKDYGEGKGFKWPLQEHGISIDNQDHVWLNGSWDNDQVYEFTTDGKFIKQFGNSEGGYKKTNADTKNFWMPTTTIVYPKTNELFVADGYGNTRIIVLDATTGAFHRMWGAFGNAPVDLVPKPLEELEKMVWGEPQPVISVGHELFQQPYYMNGGTKLPEGMEGAPNKKEPIFDPTDGPPQFFIVHAMAISNDGLVYVADRRTERVQIFTTEGKFVKSVWIDHWCSQGCGGGFQKQTATGLAFSGDPQQRFLYVGSRTPSQIWVYDRKTMEPLYAFGQRGTAPGEFLAVHMIGSDSKGNVYTADLGARRPQKFVYMGTAKRWVDGEGNMIDPKTGFVLVR